MRISSSTELRNNLAKYLDQVHDDHTPMIITRSVGKSPIVMVSLEQYNSDQETLRRAAATSKSKTIKSGDI